MDVDSPTIRNSPVKVEDHKIAAFISSLKRPATDIACGTAAKKLRPSSDEGGVKNAIMLLNELVPRLQYTMTAESGPSHSPTFTMTVEYCGQVFAGVGSSKKQAKLRAAEELLNFIRDQEPQSVADSPEIISSSSDDEANLNTPSGNGATNSTPNKNPVSILNERKPGLVYEVVSETGLSHDKTFTISVSVEGQVFCGTGHSKKMAKMAAARVAMETLYDYVFPANSADMPWRSDDISPQRRLLGDKVAERVLTKFAELTENYTSTHSRYKVIAGVALTAKDDDPSGIRLISLAAGSKCINGEFISMSGTTLNDLHAEILAVRGCRLFILNELERVMSAGNVESVETVLQRDPDSNGYMMKPNVKLHLFISSAPCGDARIFSPHEESNPENQEDGVLDRHPNRVTRGQLRTKIESGEGTIPVKSAESAQTWDGIINGERLLTMSCSDKIASWNVLGLQGSILSHLMRPIYLDSVVVGRLFSLGHLRRALYERIGQISSLPAEYRINQPVLSPTTHVERRNIQKAPGYACAWVDDGKAMEVITTNSGKLLDGTASKLSKLRLFERFAALTRSSHGRSLTLLSTYSQMKSAATVYQNAKAALHEAFKKAGHGQWVRRPPEQDQFTIDEPKNS